MNWESRYTAEPRQVAPINAVDRIAALILAVATVGLLGWALYGVCRLLGVIS